MDERERNELLIGELAKINSELDRLHGVVYDFHQIGPVEAVKQVVDEVEKLREASYYALGEVDYVAKRWPNSRIHYKMTVVANKLRTVLEKEK